MWSSLASRYGSSTSAAATSTAETQHPIGVPPHPGRAGAVHAVTATDVHSPGRPLPTGPCALGLLPGTRRTTEARYRPMRPAAPETSCRSPTPRTPRRRIRHPMITALAPPERTGEFGSTDGAKTCRYKPQMLFDGRWPSSQPGAWGSGLSDRDGHGFEQGPQGFSTQPGSGLGQGTRRRHLPFLRPGSGGAQAVHESPDDLFVAVGEERQRQDKVDHDMSRQQP